MEKRRNFLFALMLPYCLLPITAILAVIGTYISTHTGFSLALILVQLSDFYTTHLSLLIAASITLFLSKKKDGTSILSAVIAYTVFTHILSIETLSTATDNAELLLPEAFQHIDIAFSGILCGVLSAFIFNRFSNVQLPKSIAFFSGKRLIPILTGFITIAVAAFFYLVWPTFFYLIQNFSRVVTDFNFFRTANEMLLSQIVEPLGFQTFFSFDVTTFSTAIQLMQYLLLPISIYIICTQILHKKNTVLVLLCFYALIIVTTNQNILFSLLLLYVSPWIWCTFLSNVFLFNVLYSFHIIPIPLLFAMIAILYFFTLQKITHKENILFADIEDEESKLRKKLSLHILEAIGGIENLDSLSNGYDYLNIHTLDKSILDIQQLEALGDYQIIHSSESTIEIHGLPDAQYYRKQIDHLYLTELESLVILEEDQNENHTNLQQ